MRDCCISCREVGKSTGEGGKETNKDLHSMNMNLKVPTLLTLTVVNRSVLVLWLFEAYSMASKLTGEADETFIFLL